MAESGAASSDSTWPASIVHVNEDGWVLVNRGRGQGVTTGLRLLVVGDEPRELRDVTAEEGTAPTLLRIRRTYELLEVVYAEEQCAVAIAARVPHERRPQVYRAPGGELLVWVPLPPEYTWPGSTSAAATDADDDSAQDAGQDQDQDQDQDQELDDDTEAAADEDEPEVADAESLADQQDDERWEQALPLNGIEVGDLVLPALPAAASAGGGAALSATGGADAAPAEHQDTPFDAGRAYDWLKPQS